MATRILGPTGSRRRKRFLLGPVLLAAALVALFVVGSAQAVHEFPTGLQLDGNVAHSCPPAPDTGFCTTTQQDWADLFNVTNPTATTEKVSPNTSVIGPTGSDPDFTTATFTRDFQSGAGCTTNSTSGPFCTGDDTTYATGSKDTLDITGGGWQCNHDNNVNSKIDIMNTYAASYKIPAGQPNAGDKVLYFAMEKNKNNGTNDVGFWFLRGNADCSAPSGHTNWTGSPHSVGDVLVVSEFTSGGGVSSIFAYRWVGGTTPLVQIAAASGGASDCKSAFAGDTICATTNSGAKQFNTNITTPWLTSDATLGVGHTVVPPDFFEGGIDITRAFTGSGSTAPSCFNTTVGDTRSSTSLTATLFDYARGTLGECSTTLSTKAGDTANGGSASPSSIGTGSVSSGTDTATLTVNGSTNWGGTLSWYLCGPVSTDGCDNTKGVPVTSRTVSNSSPATAFVSGTATLTSAGRYCWTAHFEPDAPSTAAGISPADDKGANECFTVAPVTPTLSTTATTAVEIGSAIDDTAHLGGTASKPGTGGGGTPGVYTSINPATAGGAAGGTITFKLYGPAGATAACTTLIGTSVVTVSGNADYKASAGTVTGTLTPTAAGTYYWTAEYSGNSPNTNAKGPTTCGDTGESSRVVDAKISITPTKTNEVGVEHTFTVNIQATDASGTFGGVSGLNPVVTLTASNGATVLGKTDNCAAAAGTNASGNCTVVFHSDTGGQITGHASITFTFGGVSLTRATGDSHTGDSSDAVKTYVDAKITIAPDATNEVGKPHTFTVTLLKDTGDGNHFVAAAGEHVSFTLTDSNGAASVLDATASTCGNTGANTNTSGQCTIVFTSATAGQVTGHASSSLTVGGVPLTRATTGTLHSAGDAVKTFVDAKITIGPAEATNTVGDPHTFTVTVSQDDGLTAAQGGDGVTGFGPAPNGTVVTVTLVNSGGANYQIAVGGDTCAMPNGTVNGSCTVTFTSATAGTVTGNAAVTFLVGGVSLTRDTDSATTTIPCGGGLTTCGPAVKHFVAGSISWTKVDNGGRFQGGATFTVCKTADYDFTTGGFDSITPVCFDVLDNDSTDQDPANGKFKVVGLSLGQYTVKEKIAPAGYNPDPDTETVGLTPSNTDQTIALSFVNTRPVLKITGFGYTNSADNPASQPDGIVNGTAVYTVNLHNYGTADAVLTNSSLAVSNGGTGLTCDAPGTPLAISQTIGIGGDNTTPITLTCHYTSPNPKVITATLNIKYTTNGLERTASGSPAVITFTVNPN